MTKLIILRGNSGCGKTTTAQRLREHLGPGCLLISQDVVRRQICHASDRKDNASLQVMADLLAWGVQQDFSTIVLEGILKRNVYGDWLYQLQEQWDGRLILVYFDVSLATTLRRNQQKQSPFTAEQVRQWWLGRDVLGNETMIFDEETRVADQVETLMRLVAAD
ncbi:AAA family ATPase [Levilactobacillus tujiorum]|uniref:Kinase n=1 Tax=Levilactobacillus tujiorum TaxID=2912243 RepID=A0ABX1L7Z5_9LACO|nr:AAA family ATPase [Levilactobacillus tujiorum]MCH5465546.1 AAA family ATPase [Levilactobacillus tujiorum]NLR12943.1 kinase [Lactobacillus sp. HBUAS51387]NLR30768.1 kinase [Levilactobacillus tujiorum]